MSTTLKPSAGEAGPDDPRGEDRGEVVGGAGAGVGAGGLEDLLGAGGGEGGFEVVVDDGTGGAGETVVVTEDSSDSDSDSDSGSDVEDGGEGGVRGVCPKLPLGERRVFNKVVLQEYQGIDVAGAVIVDGLPKTSITASIAGGYLADRLKLPLIAKLTSAHFPSVCVVEKSRALQPMRLVGNRSVVVLLSEFQVEDGELAQDIVDAVFDFAWRHGCKHLFTLEGVPKKMLAQLLKKREAKAKARAEKKAKREAKAKAEAEAKAAAKEATAKSAEDKPSLQAAVTGTDEARPAAEASTDESKGKDTEVRDAKAVAATPASALSGSSGSDTAPTKGEEAAGKGAAKDGAAEKEARRKRREKRRKEKREARRRAALSPRSRLEEELGEGDPSEEMSEEEAKKLMATLMYLTTSTDMAKRLQELGHVWIKSAMIHGTTGRFLANLDNAGSIEMHCLLAPTESRLPDALSAVAIVRCLNALLDHVDIDLEPLEKKAKKLEESVGKLKALLEAKIGAGAHRTAPAGLYS